MAHVDRERDAERAAKREDAIGHRLRLLEAGDLPALAADLEPGERGASAGEADPGREGLREAIETGKAPAALEMVRRLIAEGRDPLPSLADAWDAPPPKPVLWRDPGPGAKDYGEALIGAGEVGILSGPGGAGKSTIAIALARAARPEDCPDGFGAACGLRIRSGPVAILSYEDSAPGWPDGRSGSGPVRFSRTSSGRKTRPPCGLRTRRTAGSPARRHTGGDGGTRWARPRRP